MTRGPAPVVWKKTALPVAQARGQVMIFAHSVRNLADFVIAGSGTVAFVRVRKVACLHVPVEKLAEELSGEIGRVRMIAPAVSRELWPYSRYGVLRFFRVEDDCLIELGADGRPLAAGSTAGAPDGIGEGLEGSI